MKIHGVIEAEMHVSVMLGYTYMIKVKFVLEPGMKAQSGSRAIALFFL